MNMSNDIYLYFIRLLFALPVVLALAYFMVRFTLSRRFTGNVRGRRMQLIEHLPLGPKSALGIVQVGSRYYLLAWQENSVTLVEQLDHLPEPISMDSSISGPWPGSFKTVLAGKLSGWSGRNLRDEKKREE